MLQTILLLVGAALMVGAISTVSAPLAVFVVGGLFIRAGSEMKDSPDVPIQ